MIRFALAVLAFLLPSSALAAGGVVSSADPRATAAGQDILRAGGSATDAALAMMLALTVVEPQSSGIGGGGFIVHHDGKRGTIATIDGREKAPASATPELFMRDGKPMGYMAAFPGGISTGVPGNIRLMAQAHARWGKLPWAQLFDPAIRLAEGFEINGTLAAALKRLAPLWTDFPEAQALYWQDGKPKAAGTIQRNPALAELLRAVAAQGPDAFYTGRHGQAIVDAVARSSKNPTALTLADLAAYRAVDRDAVCAPYRQFRVCGMGPPSSGATTVLQMLGMIERFDMKRLGKASPDAWHVIAEAMQLAYADREKWLGDPDFVSVPVTGLIDRAYLKRRSALIAPGKALGTYAAGLPPGAQARTAGVSGEVAGTTHFVAADGAGNVASMTSTIEGPFGSQLVANGFFLNNELTDFTFTPVKNGAPVANAPAAGKRPLSSMSPTIVYDRKGRVVFAVGSAGGKRIIMHVMKSLVGYMDWGLSAQEAIALPNIYFGGQAVLVEKGTALDAMRIALAQRGHTVVASDLGSKLNALERTPTGWRGAADPRSPGNALAE
ncbi:MAG: gamma-glutamyltransferase [Sphingomonadaceae bacterium]